MSKNENSFWWILLFTLLSALAAFGIFYTSLSNGFVWDDPGVLERQLPAFRSIKDIFFPPYGIHEFGRHYYRPLVLSSFIIDKVIWGKSPFGFHLTVVLMHVLSTLLVFSLARKFFKGFEYRNVGAFIASLVFAVHPIHAESVNWIAGRSDVMAALFFFSSLILYLKFKENDRKNCLLLSSFLFLLACLAKETAIAMILLLPVIDLSFFSGKISSAETAHHKGKSKKVEREKKREQKIAWSQKNGISIAGYVPFIVGAAVYLVVRYSALKWAAEKFYRTDNLFEMLKNILNSYGFYLGKIFLPINLTAFIPEIPSGLWSTVLSTIAITILMAFLVLSILRKKGIILFSIFFFIVTLAPSMMLIVFRISETPLADRYLYIPSFAFSLILGFAFLAIPTRFEDSKMKESSVKVSTAKELSMKESLNLANLLRISIFLILLGIILLYSIQTIKRNGIWRNDTTFWEDVAEKVPDHALPHLNLGLAYASGNRLEEAEIEYRKALESKSYDKLRALTFNSLGRIYFNRRDYHSAEEYFQQAISLRSKDAVPYFNMAVLYWERYVEEFVEGAPHKSELVEKSVQYLDKALQSNPQYSKAHNLYGEILYRFGYYKEARKHLETVLRYEKEGDLAQSAKDILDKIPSQNSK
jgi:tetratricopeptide (TPR) repeat protein